MMDVESLRIEFLRLADEFPELRHVLLVGWGQWEPVSFAYRRILERSGYTFIRSYNVTSDLRTTAYCVWPEGGAGKAAIAATEFERLAEIGASKVDLNVFQDREPRSARLEVSLSAKSSRNDYFYVGAKRSDEGRVADWLCHVFICNAVQRQTCRLAEDGLIAEFEFMALPLNSFRALGASICGIKKGAERVVSTKKRMSLKELANKAHDKSRRRSS